MTKLSKTEEYSILEYEADKLEDSINDTDSEGFYPGEKVEEQKRIEISRRQWELQTQYTNEEIFTEATRRINEPVLEALVNIKSTLDRIDGASSSRPF